MSSATTTEQRPRGGGWHRLNGPATIPGVEVLSLSWWTDRTVMVCSALENADYPAGGGRGPQWHLSVSLVMRPTPTTRPGRPEVRRTLRAFDLVGAEEDNHHPGIARHFWRPVDPARRVGCECKATEKVITERDGYRWTNPTDGPCRGCEISQLTGVACPLHTEAAHG